MICDDLMRLYIASVTPLISYYLGSCFIPILFRASERLNWSVLRVRLAHCADTYKCIYKLFLFLLLRLLLQDCVLYFIQCACSRGVDVDVRTLVNVWEDHHPGGLGCLVSHFSCCDFCHPVVVHSVYVISSCSSPDSGPS